MIYKSYKLKISLLLFILFFSFSGQTQEQRPILLINGHIITLDAENTVVDDVLIENGRFSRLGNINPDLYPRAEVIDLGGRTVVPGLIDSHMHFVRATLRPGHDMRVVEMTRSIDELLEEIKQHALNVPLGEFITIVGGLGSHSVSGRESISYIGGTGHGYHQTSVLHAPACQRSGCNEQYREGIFRVPWY